MQHSSSHIKLAIFFEHLCVCIIGLTNYRPGACEHFRILVLGSDVIYSEEAVEDLLTTLKQLSGTHTTIFLAGELRNGKVSKPLLKIQLCRS